MASEIFFDRIVKHEGSAHKVIASIQYDDQTLGTADDRVSPWAISVRIDDKDIGRLVGFEGESKMIIGMHGLKPDPHARRGFEITVFRVNDLMRIAKIDQMMFVALERWLLKRGWSGNIFKRMKHTDENLVVPIRMAWITMGFELILGEDGKWDEHVVKRWR
jgi:hypothetical protein